MAKALPAGEEERRLVMARFWQSALGFWRGPGAPVAWALTIALVAIVLAQITVQYQITVWNREFFDALERRDVAAVTAAMREHVLAGGRRLQSAGDLKIPAGA